MTETTNPEQDELTTLKSRADLLGIKYHPSIGVDKLRDKVLSKMNNEDVSDVDDEDVSTTGEATTIAVKRESLAQERLRISDEANALIRIRLTCMNPAKKEWEGEIFTVGNAVVGSIKKYVPFNAEDGWHVPAIMLQMLRDKQCQIFTTSKTKNGVSIRQGKLIKEFNIEILPPLTKTEIDELARRQAMAAGAE